MDLPSVRSESTETDGTTFAFNDSGSDLVSFIKCEDYQLVEPSVDQSRQIKEDLCRLSEAKAESAKLHCPECNKSCPSANALRLHRRRLHKPAIPVVRPQYRCTQCDKSFPFQKKLKDHQDIHNQVQCPVCYKSVVKRTLKEHIAAHEGTIRCDACNKTLSSYRALNLHRKLLHASNLDGSLRTETEGHKCRECDRTFSNTAQLNSHMRRHQQQECPVCKSMRSKASIKEHIASHDGAFRCDVCDRTFCSKRRLNLHLKTKHVPDGPTELEDGKYSCLLCNRIFDSEKQLKVHAIVHKRKRCTICGKNITQRNYQAHMAVHAYRS